MMTAPTYRIALNFEDGVTRFIDCKPGEKVLDAAYRQKVSLPMDCSYGACGTCKCRCEQGDYDLGQTYFEDALSPGEAADGMVLTCQMVPSSDCVVAVPIPSTACKTGVARLSATVAGIVRHQDAAVELELDLLAGDAPVFLPGQYINIEIPGTGRSRSYSFSSAPGERRLSFLIKHVPGGLMSAWLDQARPGDPLSLAGPLGGFYLRKVERPLLFLAGGTGLAPFLSMLEVLARRGATLPAHLLYGVTRDQDLVLVDRLEAYAGRLAGFTFDTIVAAPDSGHPRKGFVTGHMPTDLLWDGAVDVYACGPSPMIDAIREHLGQAGVTPAGFYYEKFTSSQPSMEGRGL